jgi:hypothetical protein
MLEKQENKLRLSQDVFLFVCADRGGAAFVTEAIQHSDTTVVTVPEFQFNNCKPQGNVDLVDILRPQLFSRDLYDLKPPVTRSVDFFGREEVLKSLSTEVQYGMSHIGIFGLRKIGKTSLVNRVASLIRNRGWARIVHVDLQRVNAINPSGAYLLWHLGEALFDADRQLRRQSALRLFGRYELFSEIADQERVWELFDHDLRLSMSLNSSPIVLMMDEIERIYPTSPSSRWSQDFVRVWQLLRGIDQETPGRLRFVISGTNPRCVEDHAVLGVDNPIYSYFSINYLGPLARREATDLLESYGQKVGLQWSQGATLRASEDTGGHPALLRTYGSMMHKRFLPRSQVVSPSVEDAREIAQEFLVQQVPLLAQIVAILEDQYKDEFEILKTLTLGRVYEFQELAQAFPDDTAHLLGYGLCAVPARATNLEIRLLQTYLQERERATRAEIREGGAGSLVGTRIDDEYEILSLISGHGGYADVYKAARLSISPGEPKNAAIKVLRFGQLSMLEREVDVLQSLHHSNIVRVLGSGRLPEGQVYLAMEYLDGQSLRSFCTASTRPSEKRLLDWSMSLLDALSHMHPRQEDIRALRKATVGDEPTLQSILEARYGYVHRDIKPENVIITSRGPVLIDFNISVRASAPVATVSATPGYLPNVPLGGSWSPTVDLYQLGLTLLQVAAGAEYTGENRQDLMSIAQTYCSHRTVALLEGLLKADQGGFQTAFTARRSALAALAAL